MSTQTDFTAAATKILQDADNDLGLFFSHLADNCRFRWGNDDAVQGIPAIQAAVAHKLAGVTGVRHEIVGGFASDGGAALQMEVTYTLPNGGELHTPAVTVMRFSGEVVTEYLIFQDAAPLETAAGRL
jgi:SnoaL-like domain